MTALAASSEEISLNFSDSVKNGANYVHDMSHDMSFELKPYHNGWEIIVHIKDRPRENLARLTPHSWNGFQ